MKIENNMLHWDNIQVGDILRWSVGDDLLYEIIKKVQVPDTNGWFISFKSVATGLIYRNDYRSGTFSYATLATPPTPERKQQAIINKIKYLNQRYHDRRISLGF